jgi:ABC-type ATPase involved in cell division
MPSAHVLVESPIERSFRVEQVRGLFDVPEQASIRREWDVNIPVEGTDWEIGLIVGPSGSGKTTIGRCLFPDALFHTGYQWPETNAIVDGFPEHLEGREITQALSSVGFSSPPHWLKRYSHLSNGQKFRCELARLMLEEAELVVFDEFTSVVDRDAAKVSSAAVAKALRRRGRPKLIALSCHYDVLAHLPAPGESLHALMTGRYDLCDLLDVLLYRLGNALAVRIATLSFNERNARRMIEWTTSATVGRLTVLCSRFFVEHNHEVYEPLRQALTVPHRIASSRNHCKVACFHFADGCKLALEGSANLRTNGNLEQFCLLHDDDLHDWHAQWIDAEVSPREGDQGRRSATG